MKILYEKDLPECLRASSVVEWFPPDELHKTPGDQRITVIEAYCMLPPFTATLLAETEVMRSCCEQEGDLFGEMEWRVQQGLIISSVLN